MRNAGLVVSEPCALPQRPRLGFTELKLAADSLKLDDAHFLDRTVIPEPDCPAIEAA